MNYQSHISQKKSATQAWNKPAYKKIVKKAILSKQMTNIRFLSQKDKVLWQKRTLFQSPYISKVINKNGRLFLQGAEGNFLQFFEKQNLKTRIDVIFEIMKALKELSQCYGYFYLDKHMMKISYKNIPAIWIHHNFKNLERQFPISENHYSSHIFVDSIRRVFKPIFYIPQKIKTLPQIILYIEKYPASLLFTNRLKCQSSVHSSIISPHASQNKALSFHNFNSQSAFIRQKSSYSLMKFPQRFLESRDNSVKFIRKYDSKNTLVSKQSECKQSQISKKECSQIDKKDNIKNLKSVTSVPILDRIKEQHQISKENIDHIPHGPKIVYQSHLVKNPKIRKSSAALQQSQIQWGSSGLNKKFPHSTFSTRVTADSINVEQPYESFSPLTPQQKSHNKAICVGFSQYVVPHGFSARINNKKNKTKYKDRENPNWQMGFQIEQEDSCFADDVQRLFEKEYLQKPNGPKESQLVRQMNNLFNSNLVIEDQNEYQKDFEQILF